MCVCVFLAKLINFEALISSRQLEEQLADRKCKNDSDCVYNEQCAATCNKDTKKCTGHLSRPQLIYYCLFLRKYLLDNKNITHLLESLLDKCESLKPIVSVNSVMFARNNMPLRYKSRVFLFQFDFSICLNYYYY